AEARAAGANRHECLLPVESGFGLACLPEPCEDDIFLDLEGDPFVGEGGLEYLFGYLFRENGALEYRGDWSLTREAERANFQAFVDFAMARRARNPAMHIYHYAPYEPAAFKRLMGRYASREDAIDRLLRGKVFVDLYQVVRNGVLASVESYSIKKLEPLYGFERKMPLRQANSALGTFQARLELADANEIDEETLERVRAYNEDDCRSTLALRDWLETLRSDLVACGTEVPRPAPEDTEPSEEASERAVRIAALMQKLAADVLADPQARSREQQARWVLANLLEWHHREDKAGWWEYFRLAALAADDLMDERAALSGLEFVDAVPGGTVRAPIHRYRFPPQETHIRGGEELRSTGGAPFGSVVAISTDANTVDIKKRMDTATLHPDAVFAFDRVRKGPQAGALEALGEHVAAQGLTGDGPWLAARDLLLGEAPRFGGTPLQRDGETTLEAAQRLAGLLARGVLPIQGPPGSGKTFTAARMIVELVRRGKRVGITANSHKVIRNVFEKTMEAAAEAGIALACIHKPNDDTEPLAGLTFMDDNKEFFAALPDANVAGGTSFLWARPEADGTLDVLFVDEAAQMSLANVLAVSRAAPALVLIGDPQQLEQPSKSAHPDGTGVSALDHILGGARTIAAERGLFLGETWRLHPKICAYTSEMFYEGKLDPRPDLALQAVLGGGPVPASGLCLVPVAHGGNQNSSPEEAEVVAWLVNELLARKATWRDRKGVEKPVTLDDIVIITPYNAQGFEIRQRLAGALVGTVDKFQGQEAPIAIYSMATSSYADAPRGMEFLYSLNRLNVATPRARCVSIVVCSPLLFEAECRSPRQIQLANAFCRYLEVASRI
ncbi:MAG: TM0106 family RecB-like putative nuclease, partial [Alphaproteobacteria bacterium]|nr:TM0106 family RecB-like putative nuclease [Alphaproteobacteria bacterium]